MLQDDRLPDRPSNMATEAIRTPLRGRQNSDMHQLTFNTTHANMAPGDMNCLAVPKRTSACAIAVQHIHSIQ